MGATRVVVAREMSFRELAEFRKNLPEDLEIEAFVHGAMCISYSGRCLLSNYMAGRDANRGACAHPCRWNYALVEEKRPGEYMPVFENERGTFIFNSKDLCMIRHIPELVNAGITSRLDQSRRGRRTRKCGMVLYRSDFSDHGLQRNKKYWWRGLYI